MQATNLYKKTILNLIDYIHDHPEKGVDLVGVFRLDASASEKIKAKEGIFLNRNLEDLFNDHPGPHTPSNLLKYYLRQLNDAIPFFSAEILTQLNQAALLKNFEALDVEKKLILSHLFVLLHHIQLVEDNMMTAENLSTCIGSNLLPPELAGHIDSTLKMNSFIKIALDHYDEVIEVLNVGEPQAQEIRKGWNESTDMSARKAQFISVTLKTAIENESWKTGLFGGEKVEGIPVKLPKHIKDIYALCFNLNEDNVDERYEAIKTILEAQQEGQKGHFLFFHRRHDDTQRFYKNFYQQALTVESTALAERSDEAASLLQV